MIKIGIIGVGIHGWDHCLGFDRLAESEIVAVADPNEKQLKMSQSSIQRSKPVFFTDYKDLLNMKEVEAVVIATPSNFHTQITIDALKANKDIFLEKPIAPSIEATDKIIKEYAKTDRIMLNRSQKGLTYKRELESLYLTGPTDRTVAKVELIGNFDDFEDSSGDYVHCSWSSTATGDVLAICDMNDLPKVGATV